MSKLFPNKFVGPFLLSIGLLASHLGLAQETEQASGDTDFFESRIRPIFVDHCQSCHSLATQKSSGGLLLDSREGWQKGVTPAE